LELNLAAGALERAIGIISRHSAIRGALGEELGAGNSQSLATHR
jgi:hypothetical protein